MEYILSSPWLSALVVLITQIIFIYLRTINIIYTSDKRVLPATVSSIVLSFAWLISTSIGLNSFLNGQWQPIVAFLIGNGIGSYYGIVIGYKSK